MPNQPRKSKKLTSEGELWRKEGAADLKRARLSQKGAFFIAACFCSHQAAEKSLKGFLLSRGETPPDEHSLAQLCSSCNHLHPSFAALQPLADFLASLFPPAEGFVAFRTFNEEEVKEAVDAASRLVANVRKLSKEKP